VGLDEGEHGDVRVARNEPLAHENV